jgi:hypothetical protein
MHHLIRQTQYFQAYITNTPVATVQINEHKFFAKSDVT